MTRADELTPDQEERLARWRAGAMGGAERTAFEREMLASDTLAEAAYREASLDAVAETAATPAAAPARVAGPGWNWPRFAVRVALPVAAALLAVWFVPQLLGPRLETGPAPGTDVVRGAEGDVRALEPAGVLAASPERFAWTPDPAAVSYRLEVFGPDGAMISTSVTSDTTVSAAALGVVLPASGEWRVVPVDADGHERTASERRAWSTGAR